MSLFESTPDPDEADVTELRNRLGSLIGRLNGDQLRHRDRNEIGTLVYKLVRKGGKTLTQARRNEHEVWIVHPDKDPTMDEIMGSLASLRGAMAYEYLKPDTTDADFAHVFSKLDEVENVYADATAFPYHFKEETVEHFHSNEFRSIGPRTDLGAFPDRVDPRADLNTVYAGYDARYRMDYAFRRPDWAVHLGFGAREGGDVAIERDNYRRHTARFGTTGSGKTTDMINEFRQLMINEDAGGCFIDPKGSDTIRLIEVLPDNRLDDLIVVEPTGREGYVSGFNFIDVGIDPGEEHYNAAVSMLIENLIEMLGADDYWGPRMDRVSRNLIRAMHEYNNRYPARPDLTLADFYYLLNSAASRREFAAMIADSDMPFVEDYTKDIAEMPDTDLEPILGRLQEWVEDPIARKALSFRKAEWSIPEAFDKGQIIILKMGEESEELKEMLAMAIIRRIWAATKARAARKAHARDQFYLYTDEFDNIAQVGSVGQLQTMFSESRSLDLSLNVACQYPSQVPDSVLEEILVNCNQLLAFNVGSSKQANLINDKLGVKAQTLQSVNQFEFWMRPTINGEKKEPHRVKSFAPYPPVRRYDEAKAIMAQSVAEHGRPVRTAYEEQADLMFYDGDGQLETGAGEQVIQLMSAPDPDMQELGRRLWGRLISDSPIPLGWDAVRLGETGHDEHPRTDPHAPHEEVLATADSDDLPTVDASEPVITSMTDVSVAPEYQRGRQSTTTDDVAPPDADESSETTTDTGSDGWEAPASVDSDGVSSEPDRSHRSDTTATVANTDELLSRHRADILEGIYAAALREAAAEGRYPMPGRPDTHPDSIDVTEIPVPPKPAREAIEQRIGSTGYQSHLSNALETMAGEYVTKTRVGDQPCIQLLEQGRAAAVAQDTGEAASAGGDDHRYVLRQAFEVFTALGYSVSLPDQDGDGLDVDGLADPPFTIDDVDEDLSGTDLMDAMEANKEELRAEYPAVWKLAEDSGLTFEAETSTPDKPCQPARNLMKAVNTDRRCLYVTKDESEGKGDLGYWGKRLETGLYDRQSGKQGPQVEPPAEAALPAVDDGVGTRFILGASLTEPTGDGPVERELYNTRDDLYVEERPSQSNIRALRPAADDYTHEGAGRTPAVTWTEYVEDGETSALTASDKTSGEFLRVESVDALTDSDRLRSAAPAYYYYEEQSEEYVLHVDGEEKRYQSKVEILDNWHHIKQPYVPQTEFEQPVTEDDFAIVVFPNADNEQYDQPVHYRHGECTPLYDYLGLTDTDNTPISAVTRVGRTATEHKEPQDLYRPAMSNPEAIPAVWPALTTESDSRDPRHLYELPATAGTIPVCPESIDGIAPPHTVGQVAEAVAHQEPPVHPDALPQHHIDAEDADEETVAFALGEQVGAGVYRGQILAAALASNHAASHTPEESRTAADILAATTLPIEATTASNIRPYPDSRTATSEGETRSDSSAGSSGTEENQPEPTSPFTKLQSDE